MSGDDAAAAAAANATPTDSTTVAGFTGTDGTTVAGFTGMDGYTGVAHQHDDQPNFTPAVPPPLYSEPNMSPAPHHDPAQLLPMFGPTSDTSVGPHQVLARDHTGSGVVVWSDQLPGFQAHERAVENLPERDPLGNLAGNVLASAAAMAGASEDKQHALRDLGRELGRLASQHGTIEHDRPVPAWHSPPHVPEYRGSEIAPERIARPSSGRVGEPLGESVPTGPPGEPPVLVLPLPHINTAAADDTQRKNCAPVAAATDYTLRGIPTIVQSDGREHPEMSEHELCQMAYPGRRFSRVDGWEQVEQRLTEAGHGATGIIGTSWHDESGEPQGHFLNAINWHGNIFYLDGQVGEVEHEARELYTAETFLRTR
ncbi:toxin glutamine deamidase domain-containing protein [Allorhizocola rhizosphaerae]|uniref:toxin glutamine deamidase domain-containing protein n=1 Tax=Allorhizocola rhizosphaerae TaxID=1872709 RepID=UPI000E3E03FB|nr:toxin glutamine deamidase domain-containing protein [Allorhizocola rhizosphaerae]